MKMASSIVKLHNLNKGEAFEPNGIILVYPPPLG